MDESENKLLIVDDDEALQRQLRWAFDGFDVSLAGSRKAAMAVFEQEPAPVVLLDLGLPPDQDGPSEGLAALESILALAPETKIIVMSGQAERQYAVRAIGLGAYDFYDKPIDIETLNLIVRRALNLYRLEAENRRLQKQYSTQALPGVVAVSPEMVKICGDIHKFANTGISVLLTGESGTGKELFARAVHTLSDRSAGPFVAINCAAIPEPLLESELFGHEKGAFTGAIKTTIGKVEQADKGTLFLDEIGDMPLPLQAKLLRFLEQRVMERVGGRREIAVDTRIVSATNQDPIKAQADGTFRQDLHYRLAETVVKIPPLRERGEDALLIARHVLVEQAREQGSKARGFSKDACGAILAYPWPGNVRELQNKVRRAVVVMTEGRKLVTAADLELLAPSSASVMRCLTLRDSQEQAERAAVVRAMSETNGNISRAAHILEVSRPTLYILLRQYDLKS